MSFEDIKKLIKEGKLSSALSEIKELNDDQSSLKLFSEVYNLTTWHPQKIPSSATAVGDLFELTSILCRRIMCGGKFDVTKLGKALHFVVQFFIGKSRTHARKLGEYFIELAAFGRDGDSPVDCAVVESFAFKFRQLISENILVMINSMDDDSFDEWIDFAFRLHEAYPAIQYTGLFPFLQRSLFNVRNHCRESLADVAALYLSKLARWSSAEAFEKIGPSPANDKMFENLMLFVKILFIILEVAEISSMADDLSNFLKGLRKIWPSYRSDLELVVSFFDASAAIYNKKNYIRRFDSFFQAFNSQDNPKTLLTVLAIFNCYLSLIKETTDIVEDRIADWSRMFLHIFKQLMLRKETVEDAYQLVYCAFTIICRSSLSKNALLLAFPTAKAIMKHISHSATEEDSMKLKYFTFSVVEMTSTLNAYRKVELNDELIQLWRYLMPMFLKVSPDTLLKNPKLESCINTWLRVFSSLRYSQGMDNQVVLLVFTSVHPRFMDQAMEAWASMKLSKSKLLAMDATVADVFEAYRDDMVKRYPDFKPDNLDFNQLLLSEVRAYCKWRDQLNKPIIAVYKKAAKMVKNHVYLANILCCTIDALCLSTDGNVYLPSLEKSLVNITAHLRKLEHGKTVEDFPALLCTLGNLYYLKSRLELHRIRKKAEEEELEKQNHGDNSKMVILQENAKDDLDMTEVAFMTSPVKLSKQPEIFKFLELAVKYWTDAESLLTPHPALATTLSYIKGAGYLCRLYAAHEKDIQCWQLMYRIAGKLESEEGQLLAVSELLARQQVVPPAFIANVESFLPNVKKNWRKHYLVNLYFVSAAKNLFLCGKVDESRKALQRLDSLGCLPFLVKMQYRTLTALIDMTDPDVGQLSADGQPPYASLLKNVENLLYVIKVGTYETFNEATVVQLLIIDCLAMLIVYCTDLSSVRMARCYIKAHTSLVRRLAVPARICEITSLQCWVDLLTWNTSDTDLNAKEVEKMLEMGIMVDGHGSSPSQSGSPRLSSHVRCYPHFLKSGNDCDCVFCRDVHYQVLALSSIMIRAKILIGFGYNHDARNVLNVGLSVVEVIKEKAADSSVFWTLLYSPIARFYHFVANSKIMWKKYKEALHYANLARNILLGQSAKNRILLGSIERVLLMVQFAESCPIQPISRPKSILHVKSQIESVTPENKKSTKTSIIDNAPAKPAIEMGDRKYLDRKKTRSTQPLAFGESSNQSSNLNVPDKAPSIVITPPPAGNPAKMHSTAGRLGRKAVLFSSPDKENDSKSGNAFLGTPGIAQLGNSATPAIKVFYDPEGLESKSTARRKPKSTRDLKLSTTGKRTKLPRTAALEKIGTPLPSKASRTRKLFSTIDPSDWDADLAVGNGTPKSAKGAGKSSDIESGNRLEKNEDDAPSGQPTPGSSGISTNRHLKTPVRLGQPVLEPPGDDLSGIAVANDVTGDKVPGNDVPAPLDNFNGVASLEEELETELQPHVSNKSMNETAIGVTPTALKKVKARRHIIDSSMESIDENAHQPNPGSRHGPAVAGLNASEKSRIPKVNMGPPDSADVKKSNHLTLPKGRRKLDLRKASPSSSSAKPLTSRFLEIEDSSADETIIGVSPSMLQKVRARRNLLNGTIVPADPSFLEDSSIDSISSAGNSGYPDENVPTGSDCIGKSSVEKTRPIGLLKAPVPLSDKESPGGRIENIKGRSKMLDSSAEKKASPSSPKKVRARRNILGGSRYHENASSGSISQAKAKLNDVFSSKANTGQSRLSKVAKPCPKKADTFSKSEKNSTSSSDFILIGVTPRSLEKVRARRSPLEESFDTREKSGPSEASRCRTGVADTLLLKAKPAAGNAGNADPSLADQADKPPKTLDEQLASEMWKLEIQKTPITRNAKSRVERAEQPNSAAEVGAIGVPPSANRVPSADPCSSDSEADVSGIVGPSPPDISQNRTRSLQLTPAKGILQQLSSLSLKTPSSRNPDSHTDSTASKTGIASKTVRTRKK